MKTRLQIENYIERLNDYKEDTQNKINDLRDTIENNAFRMTLDDLSLYSKFFTKYVNTTKEFDTMINTLLWVLEDEVVKPM